MLFVTSLLQKQKFSTTEKYINGGERVPDVGCGSGILGVAGLLLGAQKAVGVDIDPLAVKKAWEKKKATERANKRGKNKILSQKVLQI